MQPKVDFGPQAAKCVQLVAARGSRSRCKPQAYRHRCIYQRCRLRSGLTAALAEPCNLFEGCAACQLQFPLYITSANLPTERASSHQSTQQAPKYLARCHIDTAKWHASFTDSSGTSQESQ
jgi:hypothetical protein